MTFEKLQKVFKEVEVEFPRNLILGHCSVEDYNDHESWCCGFDAYPHPHGVRLVDRCYKRGSSQDFIIHKRVIWENY